MDSQKSIWALEKAKLVYCALATVGSSGVDKQPCMPLLQAVQNFTLYPYSVTIKCHSFHRFCGL